MADPTALVSGSEAAMWRRLKVVPFKRDRDSAFWTEVLKARLDQPGHFLHVFKSIDDFKDNAPIADGLSIHALTTAMLRASGQAWYERWDSDLFDTFKNPEDIFAKCIWGIYRKVVSPGHIARRKARRSSDAVNRKAHNDALKKEAARKRAEKEQEQKLTLGGGDIEEGTRKFNKRMTEQKAVKYAKASDNVILPLQKKFTAWWASRESDLWRKGMCDVSPQQFQFVGPYTPATKRDGKRFYIGSDKAMREILRFLANHPKAASVAVRATLEWSATTDPYSVPATFVHAEDDFSPLQGQARLTSPHTFRLLGLDENKQTGKLFFVSSKNSSGIYRLFPKKLGFEVFENRNPQKSSMMRVLYACQAPIIMIQAETPGGAIQLNLRLGRGEDSLSAEAIKTLFADATSRANDSAIERLTAAKEARDIANRTKGKQKAKEPENEQTDKMDALGQIALARASGLLSAAEFNTMIAKISSVTS